MLLPSLPDPWLSSPPSALLAIGAWLVVPVCGVEVCCSQLTQSGGKPGCRALR